MKWCSGRNVRPLQVKKTCIKKYLVFKYPHVHCVIMCGTVTFLSRYLKHVPLCTQYEAVVCTCMILWPVSSKV